MDSLPATILPTRSTSHPLRVPATFRRLRLEPVSGEFRFQPGRSLVAFRR